MHKLVTQSFIIIVKYYALFILTCALLLYNWQCSRFVTSASPETLMELCYDAMSQAIVMDVIDCWQEQCDTHLYAILWG
jgi:hypothetical protein